MTTKKYTCFFIGQMSNQEDLDHLDRLAEELLKPILDKLDYEIVLPNAPAGSEDIFKFVMKQLDTAELLIADLSNDNPNVYYEVAIRHSLGLPYVLISTSKPRFDISTLRCVRYDAADLTAPKMVKELTEWIHARHETVLKHGDSDNPITNFYGIPLVEVSPASGLGLGYFRNFVSMIVRDMHSEENELYINEELIPHHERENIRLDVWIPDQLIGAQFNTISALLLNKSKLHRAYFKSQKDGPNKPPRIFPLYALPDRSHGITLVDIPTALNALEVAITGRYSKVRLDKREPEWKKLEREEIDRFWDTLNRHIGNSDDVYVQQVTMTVWIVNL